MSLVAANEHARNAIFAVQCAAASTLRIENFRGRCVQAFFPLANRGMVLSPRLYMCYCCAGATLAS